MSFNQDTNNWDLIPAKVFKEFSGSRQPRGSPVHIPPPPARKAPWHRSAGHQPPMHQFYEPPPHAAQAYEPPRPASQVYYATSYQDPYFPQGFDHRPSFQNHQNFKNPPKFRNSPKFRHNQPPKFRDYPQNYRQNGYHAQNGVNMTPSPKNGKGFPTKSPQVRVFYEEYGSSSSMSSFGSSSGYGTEDVEMRENIAFPLAQATALKDYIDPKTAIPYRSHLPKDLSYLDEMSISAGYYGVLDKPQNKARLDSMPLSENSDVVSLESPQKEPKEEPEEEIVEDSDEAPEEMPNRPMTKRELKLRNLQLKKEKRRLKNKLKRERRRSKAKLPGYGGLTGESEMIEVDFEEKSNFEALPDEYEDENDEEEDESEGSPSNDDSKLTDDSIIILDEDNDDDEELESARDISLNTSTLTASYSEFPRPKFESILKYPMDIQPLLEAYQKARKGDFKDNTVICYKCASFGHRTKTCKNGALNQVSPSVNKMLNMLKGRLNGISSQVMPQKVEGIFPISCAPVSEKEKSDFVQEFNRLYSALEKGSKAAMRICTTCGNPGHVSKRCRVNGRKPTHKNEKRLKQRGKKKLKKDGGTVNQEVSESNVKNEAKIEL